MYQELQIFKDSFEGCLLWGTEGNDLPIPGMAKGDVFELPGAHWWEDARHRGLAYRVVSVCHVFEDSGQGPECNHLMKVVIEEFNPEQSEFNSYVQELESDLERTTQKVEFLEHLATSTGGLAAPMLLEALINDIVASMKNDAAFGIENAENAWHEAAIILNSDGHLLAETTRNELRGKISHAFKALSSTDRIALWIEHDGLKTWMEEWDDFSWDKHSTSFDPIQWNGAFDEVEECAMELLIAKLPDIEY